MIGERKVPSLPANYIPRHELGGGEPGRLEAHAMDPMNVLRMVKSMGGAFGRILIVGCEPAEIGSDEEGKLGLSET